MKECKSSWLQFSVLLLVVQGNKVHSRDRYNALSTPPPGCAGKPEMMSRAMNDALQNFQSPGYPNNYPNSVDCTWIIEAESMDDERAVKINFDDFVTENCSDFLEIRDGKDPNGSLLGCYCGVHNSSSWGVVSESTAMRIRFHSNGRRTYRGFSAWYYSVHSNRTSNFHGRNFYIFVLLCSVGALLAVVLTCITVFVLRMRKTKRHTLQLARTNSQSVPGEEANVCLVPKDEGGTQPYLLYVRKQGEHVGPPPCYTELV